MGSLSGAVGSIPTPAQTKNYRIMKERTTAQICARMREIRESRKSHPKHKSIKCEVQEYEQTMVVQGGRKRQHYMTSKQIMEAYEREEWGGQESRRQMFEAGKGTRFTKRVNVNTGSHYTKSGVTSTKRPTAQGEVCSVGRVITVKRFSNSRLTCVCKSVMY